MRATSEQDRQHWQRVDEIFAAVIETPAREWAARLDGLCGSDAALRADVSRLLASDGRMEAGFLEPPAAMPPPSGPAAAGATADGFLIQECSGTIIGPYTLHEQIGEGGFGVVYLAEQHRPVRRRVALKIIKPGMDTRQVIARFQAERQALALMDHPHIARVLDGGETAAGLPYFVMELVKGIPITEYCDQCSLTARQRLELFIPVCQAVQHAHQKGIIHRDLKPSNVMIAMQDGQPAPKVIDFGVAKAINQRLTEHTVYTQFAQLVGTPLYMSPEQAEMSPLEVDTRSDIYSLGAMLYELLTGTTPFERERLRQVSLDDLRRIIRQEEPPTPSNRLSMLGDRAAAIAQHRRTDPRRLRQLVRGDLDWIVMKALEKDRTRRYETASALAGDVERYLHDEPVEARPPSAAYKFRKFVHRNRVALTATALVVITVVAGLAASMVLIASERDAARTSADRADLERARAQDNLRKARDVVDRMLTRVADDLWNTPHMTEFQRDLYEEALEFYEGFLEQESDDPTIRYETARACIRVALIHGNLGNQEQRVEPARRAVAISEQLVSDYPDEIEYLVLLADSYHELFWAFFYSQRNDEHLEPGFKELEIRQDLAQRYPNDPEHRRQLATRHVDLGSGFSKIPGRLQEAEAQLREAVVQWERFRKDFPGLPIVHDLGEEAYALHGLANILLQTHRFQEAEIHLRRAVEIRTRLVEEKPDHHGRLDVLGSDKICLGWALSCLGRVEEAEQQFRSAVEIYEPLVQLFPAVPVFRDHLHWALRDLATALYAKTDVAEAESMLREQLARSREQLGDGHPQTVEELRQVAKLLYARGEFAGAEALLRTGLASARAELGDEHPAVSSLLGKLTETLLKQGKYGEAETVVRECLATRQRLFPDGHPEVWLRHCAVSLLGGALAGQAAALGEADPQAAADLFAEAEPLLLDGYDGMKDDPRIAHPSRNYGFDNVGEALERIVQLYEAWNDAEPEMGYDAEAAQWRAELEQWQAGLQSTSDSTASP